MAEEITCLKQDKAILEERLTEMNRTVQNVTHAMQEEQHAKDQAKEDYTRYGQLGNSSKKTWLQGLYLVFCGIYRIR